MLLMRLVFLLVVSFLVVTGCGKKVETVASAEGHNSEALKVAFVYVGPIGDGGWSFAHNNGRLAVDKEFGHKVVTSYVESVPESAADAERVFRDLAAQGNKLIFGTSFGYMEAMLKVAKEFPDVHFEHATGYKTAANLAQYDARTYEGAYLSGVVAGQMTKSNKLGFVASIPIPEVIRNINAYTLGAQSVNPNVSTKVVWVNAWFNPGKEREAATTLVGQGVDVLMQNTDSPAILQLAQEKGVYAFGWDSDMTNYGPKAHLASSVINWGGYYVERVRDQLGGSWQSTSKKWGLREGMIDQVSYNSLLPPAVKERAKAVKDGIKNGTFSLWQGPIVDTVGKMILKDGENGSEEFLSKMNFYVKGVEGSVPK